MPIAAAVGILHDLEAGQLVGIARVGTGQVPRAAGDADAEDGQVLGILSDAQGVGGGELAIDQVGNPIIVGAAPAELEVTLGLVAISGSDDSELPIVLAENFVGAEADRMTDPLHLEGTSIGTVDVGTGPGLVVVGISGSVGIVRLLRRVVVRNLLLVVVLLSILLSVVALVIVVLPIMGMGGRERGGKGMEM